MAGKLGIIAGGGELPRMLIEACRSSGREFFVFALKNHADSPVIEEVPHAWLRLGAAGEALRLANEYGIEEIVMGGRVKRPSLAGLRPDWRAFKFVFRVMGKALGDDGLLRCVIDEIESEGLKVVAPDSILTDLKPEKGPLGRHGPDQSAERDIDRGVAVLNALSSADVGQAVVVQDGLVLGIEAIEGTDALLQRCGELRRDGDGGVLIKLQKRNQEERVDLPTIGPETVRRAAAAGLRGIAVQADGSLVLNREETVRLADESGLFVIAIDTA
ncbi:MAG: UDP-2,3-diacylglucosamine diphosphatase LpxI [Alphaproteobacteria bacterium]|nr:UDP-2,3-diacylglucosamine diphosphatase LpxI [Alphaproteobacteria bacterium]